MYSVLYGKSVPMYFPAPFIHSFIPTQVAMRLETSVQSRDDLYTDLNGLQVIRFTSRLELSDIKDLWMGWLDGTLADHRK